MNRSGGQTTTPYSLETTNYDDILIKKGICDRQQVLLAKGMSGEQLAELLVKEAQDELFSGKHADPSPIGPTLEETLEDCNLGDIDDIEDDFCDDSILEIYRERRIAEMKAKAKLDKFGEISEIRKADWNIEVNDASKETWVVVLMYEPNHLESEILLNAFGPIPKKFKHVKFVQIRASLAVENWPERQCPAVFLYNEGEAKQQVIGLAEFGGRQMNCDNVEWFLAQRQIVETELEIDPRVAKPAMKMSRNAVHRSGLNSREDDSVDHL